MSVLFAHMSVLSATASQPVALGFELSRVEGPSTCRLAGLVSSFVEQTLAQRVDLAKPCHKASILLKNEVLSDADAESVRRFAVYIYMYRSLVNVGTLLMRWQESNPCSLCRCHCMGH